jgi:hypothetical protein
LLRFERKDDSQKRLPHIIGEPVAYAIFKERRGETPIELKEVSQVSGLLEASFNVHHRDGQAQSV